MFQVDLLRTKDVEDGGGVGGRHRGGQQQGTDEGETDARMQLPAGNPIDEQSAKKA